MRVTGTFEVSDFTPAQVPAPDIKTGLPVGVATMRKRFEGGVSGRSATIFAAAYDPATETGTYVAMESFEGRLDDRAGAFNFAHSTTTQGDGGGAEYLVIVPASGTGALAGIQGTGGLEIDPAGTHRIWFDYDIA
jgi:hypothetical protein